MRSSVSAVFVACLAALGATCGAHEDSTDTAAIADVAQHEAQRPIEQAAAPIADDPPEEAASDEPASSDGVCPAEMAVIEGKYCPLVDQPCLERQDPGSAEERPERFNCQHFAPSICVRPELRRSMRFCMDRYEWPNRRGELPHVLVSWLSARKLCASVGKRLCSDREFTFACEGESMRPYVYGFTRSAGACNVDKPYRERRFAFAPWDRCMDSDSCRASFEAIDQRTPSGSLPLCKSEAGVFDLNGNVNEWVITSKGHAGLKGGWWGPVRNRCRPTVTFHRESDFGYEVGFRCCADLHEQRR